MNFRKQGWVGSFCSFIALEFLLCCFRSDKCTALSFLICASSVPSSISSKISRSFVIILSILNLDSTLISFSSIQNFASEWSFGFSVSRLGRTQTTLNALLLITAFSSSHRWSSDSAMGSLNTTLSTTPPGKSERHGAGSTLYPVPLPGFLNYMPLLKGKSERERNKSVIYESPHKTWESNYYPWVLGSYQYYFQNAAIHWIHCFWISILVVLSEYLSLREVCDLGIL